MGHEFGHGIARYRPELNSWELVTTCAIFSRLALRSIALFPAIALGCVLSAFVKDVVIGKWLSQQLEYEADVIGTAIGKVAGCSLEDILYAMSCTEILCHRTYEFKLTQSGVPALQQEALASLRALVPNGQLPKTVYDSLDVQMAQATIEKELSTAPDGTMQLARKHVINLELSLARSMTYLRDPLQPWAQTHSHWLDRIANVKASSHLQSAQAAWLDLTRRPCNDGQALLQAFHASLPSG